MVDGFMVSESNWSVGNLVFDNLIIYQIELLEFCQNHFILKCEP